MHNGPGEPCVDTGDAARRPTRSGVERRQEIRWLRRMRMSFYFVGKLAGQEIHSSVENISYGEGDTRTRRRTWRRTRRIEGSCGIGVLDCGLLSLTWLMMEVPGST